MDHIGMDAGMVSSHICELTEAGEVVERQIRTERRRLQEIFGRRRGPCCWEGLLGRGTLKNRRRKEKNENRALDKRTPFQRRNDDRQARKGTASPESALAIVATEKRLWK